jgi:hypothetical protein
VRELLAQATMADVAMCLASDLFEMGGRGSRDPHRGDEALGAVCPPRYL